MRASKPAFKLQAPVIPEGALHQQIHKVLTIEIAPPGRVSLGRAVWYSIDIANYGGNTPGLRTSRGVIAGIPDVFLLWGGTAFFIELKREGGLLSDAQQALIPALLIGGGRCGVATTAEEVLALLDVWGVPRRRAVRL
jgi:hypothetical protein